MKREQVREHFPDATDDQIDGILNAIRDELNPLKAELKRYTGLAESATAELEGLRTSEADLKAQLDARMTDAERLKAREDAADAREREFTLKSNALDARAVFVEAGIAPTDGLIEQVVSADAERTVAHAKAIVELMNATRESAVQATREEMLRSNPVPQGSAPAAPTGTPATLKDFLALPDVEQVALKASDPGIVSRLMAQK